MLLAIADEVIASRRCLLRCISLLLAHKRLGDLIPLRPVAEAQRKSCSGGRPCGTAPLDPKADIDSACYRSTLY